MASPDSDFVRLVSQLDYSLFIVTVAAGEERAGCLIGFATQVSIDPPRFLACLSVKNRTYRVAAHADTLVVHPVPEEAEELAVLFGGETGDEVDKFSRCKWISGPGGVPILSGLRNWFAGRVAQRLEFGDHVGFLLEPTQVSSDDGDSLGAKLGRFFSGESGERTLYDELVRLFLQAHTLATRLKYLVPRDEKSEVVQAVVVAFRQMADALNLKPPIEMEVTIGD